MPSKDMPSWVPKRKDVPELVFQFLIGGTVVAGVSALSTLCSPKEAALVYALPITYVPIVLYVWRHARKKTCALLLRSFVGQGVASSILLLLFCLSLYFIVSAYTPRPQDNKSDVMGNGELWAMIAVSLLFVLIPMKMYWDWVCNKDSNKCKFTTDKCVLG